MNSRESKIGLLIKYLIDLTSFNSDTKKALSTLNKRIERPEKVFRRLISHPGGYSREISKRRISIAEAYLKIVTDQQLEHYEERIYSLQSLIQQSQHAKNVSMPFNTARVQIALMKEAVKHKGNTRRQLELVSDFTIASFGHEAVIRKLLKELDLIQIAETEKQLKDLDLGWDSHVHDSMSEGKKTPTQVLLEAFVKGVSSVTLVYYDITKPQIIREAFAAGRILGINVNIGIEFSVGPSRNRRHYMYMPGHFETADEFFAFFKKHEDKLKLFHEGLEKNAEYRKNVIDTIIKHFNETHLIKLNQAFDSDSMLRMPTVSWEDLSKFVVSGQYSRIHLSELIFERLIKISHSRVLHLKVQYQIALAKKSMGLISQWELDQIKQQYETQRRYYEEMSPERLKEKLLEDKAIVDYDSAFLDEESIFPLLMDCGGDIKFIHPLEVGLKTAVFIIVKNYRYIKRSETFNSTDCSKRNPNELILFNRFIELVNNKPLEELKKFISDWGIDVTDKEIGKAYEHYHESPLIPECGSDATGHDPKIPGLGFIKSKSLFPRTRSWFMQQHSSLPMPISSLIIGKGRPISQKEWNALADDERHIVQLGRPSSRPKNLVGDERGVEIVGFTRYMRYLNPVFKNFFRFIIGFAPAYLTFGFMYTGIWFGITFIRNMLVDFIAAHGYDMREWSLGDVNFDNAFQSLFWTGFSIPLLNAVKLQFDLSWGTLAIAATTTPLLKEVVKFFFICLVNGLYIMTHNKIRNFDRKVIKANFFRSVLAWPFATVFSPLGNAIFIPSIVQAKFWSDVVGGMIEGSGKFTQRIVLRKRDLHETLPLISSPDKNVRMAAALDVLYIWARQQRGNTCLEQIFLNKTVFYKNILNWLFSKPEDPAVVEARTLRARKLFDSLFDFFSDEGCPIAMNYFVLENYSQDDAVILTNIIGSHFEHFKEWLYELKKKMDKEGEKPVSGE